MTLGTEPPCGPIFPPCYPLPRMIFEEEVTIQHCAMDADCKSWELLYWMGHPVQVLPAVLPYPVPMTKEDKQWL